MRKQTRMVSPGVRLYLCNPELNKPCEKRICKYNTNAVEKLCDCTKEKKYALKFGQKAKTTAYTPGQNK